MPRLAIVAFAVGCAGLSAAVPATEIAQSPPRKAPITIARDTTYFLEPVKADGTIDYAAALDAVYGTGLRPEDNAAIPLFQAFGPDSFLQGPKEEEPNARKRLADVLQRLEIPFLPQSGPYFRPPDPSVLGDVLKAMKSPWAGEEYPRVHAWLTANEGPLARIVEASRKPRLWFPHPKGSPIGSPPYLNELRWAANALSARAMLQLRAGNMGAAWSDALAIHRLAALQARDGYLLAWLLGQGNGITAHETAAVLITQGNPDAASARARLAELAAISSFPVSAEVADRIARAETLDLVSRLAVERSAEALKFLDVPALAWDRVDWNVVLRTVNGWVDRLVAIGRRPMGRDRRGALQLWLQQEEAADLAARKTLAPEVMKGAARTAISRALGDLLSSAFISGPSVTADDYNQLRGDLNRVALALAVYRADNGEYPVRLAALAPRVLTRLPRDPLTGAAIAYERQGAGYLLYSPGLDQKFDRERGGSGDDVFLRVR